MKQINFWQSLLIAIMLLPATVIAQPFNNHYTFIDITGVSINYTNSYHTDGVQISNGYIVEGGTIDNPMIAGGPTVVEIGNVGTIVPPPPPPPPPAGNGMMAFGPFYYADPNNGPFMAVDLIESLVMPNWVIQVTNYIDPFTGLNRIMVWKTDPATGALAWSLIFGVNINEDLIGVAITRDFGGDYYVLGHTRNAAGVLTPYLNRITDAGAVVWENIYFDPNFPNSSHESVDLIYDPTTDHVVFTTNRSNPFPFRDGILTIEVNATFPPGVVVTASHLPTLTGNPDFNARDMDLMINGEYAIVGAINSFPPQGFMVRYLPGLTPAFPMFSCIYNKVPGTPLPLDIYLTGVKPYPPTGGIIASYEMVDPTGVLVPGMVELMPNGTPVPGPSNFYNTAGPYIGSRGLISLNGGMDFAIKGELFDGANGVTALSLIAANFPLPPFPMPFPPLCSDTLTIVKDTSDIPFIIPFKHRRVQTYEIYDIIISDVHGTTYDCNGNPIGNFKLAATGIEESAEALGMSIYPNPTDGNFTIELSDEMTEIYQTGEIYNALGEVVMTFNVNNTIEKIDLTKQVPGIYLVRLKASNGNVSDAKRIMVK